MPADDRPAPRPVRAGAYFTEADLAAAARLAVARRKNPDGSAVTQADVARIFGTSQALVSQALGYDSPTARARASTARGGELRRRIVRAWGDGGGLAFAGPYWRAVGPLEEPADLPGRFAPDVPPFGRPNATSGRVADGLPLPSGDDTIRGRPEAPVD